MKRISYALKHDNVKHVLILDVRLYGTTEGRKRIRVKGLINPNYEDWDEENRKFRDRTDTARVNNPKLEEIRRLCEELANNERITTPAEFIEAYKKGVAPSCKPQTLGEYLDCFIEEKKNGTDLKLPTGNYQNYVTLRNKLRLEGKIISKPLRDIDDRDFIQFSDFILKELKGVNYVKLMGYFKSVHSSAYTRYENENILRYPYKKYAPHRETIKRPSLSVQQYNGFCGLNRFVLPQKGGTDNFELNLDFCIFLYETKSRPVDVLKVKYSDFTDCEDGLHWEYIPDKKRNKNPKIADVALSATALRILDKYKGQSSEGYVFPFAMNNRVWNFDNADSWHRWDQRRKDVFERLNKWLKKLKPLLGVDFDFTLYTFRHTALTHACNAEGANLMWVATEAGTSIEMLENHYYDRKVKRA